MYQSTTGKIFLDAYNRREGTSYTGKSFFEEVFVPLFFDHEKYMMTAGNSPIANAIKISDVETIPKRGKDEDMISGKIPFETQERRSKRIQKMKERIDSDKADASIAIGYRAVEETAATVSQTTNRTLPEDKEKVYLSWVGAGLGVGVEGGIIILFDHALILLDIFDGWQYYRKYLDRNHYLKGNQINTWNARWLAYRYSDSFDSEDPIYGMDPLEKKEKNDEILDISTIPWTRVLLPIATKYEKEKLLIGYFYNIGQQNTTFGFLPFQLEGITRPERFYAKIFGEDSLRMNRGKIEEIFGGGIGVKCACENGSIGVEALRPKDLIPYIKGKKAFKYTDEQDQKITFNTYIIWILAMLNKEQLWEKSQEIARLLQAYEAHAKKGRTDRINNVKQLLDAVSARQFLLALIPIVNDESDKEQYEQLGKIVHEMPSDNFPYFNTLIRFQYAILKH